jgi:hypothetical protein
MILFVTAQSGVAVSIFTNLHSFKSVSVVDWGVLIPDSSRVTRRADCFINVFLFHVRPWQIPFGRAGGTFGLTRSGAVSTFAGGSVADGNPNVLGSAQKKLILTDNRQTTATIKVRVSGWL